MKISNIAVHKVFPDARLKAFVSFVVDGELAIHNAKVIQGSDRLFVQMPSDERNGIRRDIVHPITQGARREIENAILAKYAEYIQQHPNTQA